MTGTKVTIAYVMEDTNGDVIRGEFMERAVANGKWSIWTAFDEAAKRFKETVSYKDQGKAANKPEIVINQSMPVIETDPALERAIQLVLAKEGHTSSNAVTDSVIDALRAEAEKLQAERNSALIEYDDLVAEFDRERVDWETERSLLVDERDAALAALEDVQSAIEGLNSVSDKYV